MKKMTLFLTLLGLFSTNIGLAWEDPNLDSTVLYYEFSQSTSSLTDDTSNVATNHGDIHYGTSNEPTWVSETNNVSAHYDFDGNDYIESGPAPEASFGTNAFTVSKWINPDISFNGFLVNKGDLTPVSLTKWYSIFLSTGEYIFHVQGASTQSRVVTSGAGISTNEWTHVVTTRDSNGLLSAYINGVRKGQVSGGIDSVVNTNSVFVGAVEHNGAIAGPFNGQMDSVKIYSGMSLSSNEVYHLWRKERTDYGYEKSSGTVVNF